MSVTGKCHACGRKDVWLQVVQPPYVAHSGIRHTTLRQVDACIAPLVEGLNRAGLLTANSCCGHGDGPGSVFLHGGGRLDLPVVNSGGSDT